MGNRAVITTEDKHLGIYLHWNGGRDSVEGFLGYCKLKGYRSPETDNYGWARLAQVCSNFFGDGLSVGIDVVSHLDCKNGDNGVYIIKDWQIVGRLFFEGEEQHEYDLVDFMVDVDSCMPADQQLGEAYIKAKEVPYAELKIGDKVFMESPSGRFEAATVIGFGKDEYCNGTNVKGLPYVDWLNKDGDPSKNPNNYLGMWPARETVRRLNDDKTCSKM